MLAQVTEAKTLFPKMAAIADVTWALQRMPPQARGGRSCMVKRAEPISCDRSAPNQSASQPLPPQAARDRRPSPPPICWHPWPTHAEPTDTTVPCMHDSDLGEPGRMMARIRQVSRPRSCCATTILMAQQPPGRHGSFAARVRPNPSGPSTGPGPPPNRPGKGGDSDAVRVPRWWAPARRRND